MPKPLGVSVTEAFLCVNSNVQRKFMEGTAGVVDLSPGLPDLENFGAIFLFITDEIGSTNPWETLEQAVLGAGVFIPSFEGTDPKTAYDWLLEFDKEISENANEIKLKISHTALARVPTTPLYDIISLKERSKITRGTKAERYKIPETCEIPPNDFRQWKVSLPAGTQLALPLDVSQATDVPRAASKMLSGQLLQTYLGTFAVADSDGSFQINMREFSSDILGYPLTPESRGKGEILRAQSSATKQIKDHLRTLKKTMLVGFEGHGTLKNPHYLMREEILEKDGIEKTLFWKHSEIIWRATQTVFTQFPKKALHLDSKYMSLALSMAIFLRGTANDNRFKWLQSRRIDISLLDLAETLQIEGQIEKYKKRSSKKRAWQIAADEIEKVIVDGKFGRIHLSDTTPESRLIIEPSEILGSAYSQLPEKQQKQIEKQEKREQRKIRGRVPNPVG